MSDEKNGFTQTEDPSNTMPPPYPGNEQFAPPSAGKGQSQTYGAPPLNVQPQTQSPYVQAMQAYEANVMIAEPYPQSIAMGTGPQEVLPRPTDWMVPSILACLCCFWPVGICAIIAASNAKSAADRGDMVTANQKANTARNLIIISVILGIISAAASVGIRLYLNSNST